MSHPHKFRGGRRSVLRGFRHYSIERLESRTLLSSAGVNHPQQSFYYNTGVINFPAGDNGISPIGNVVVNSTGNIFGIEGDLYGNRDSIYEIPAGSQTPVELASFVGSNMYLAQSIVMDGNGNLFGTTYGSLPVGAGAVFELSAASIASGNPTIVQIASFDAYNDRVSSLIVDSHGNLFGTAFDQFGDTGSVFEIAAGSHAFTTLASLTGLNGMAPPLALDANGNLFGATFQGGTSSDGSIFEITSIASGNPQFANIASFDGQAGRIPDSLVVDSQGNLFGACEAGGANDEGALFEISAADIAAGTGAIKLLASSDSVKNVDPANLIIDAAGDLLGTCNTGLFGCTAASKVITPFLPGQFLYSQGMITMEPNGNLLSVGNYQHSGELFEFSPIVHLTFQQQPTGGAAFSKMVPDVVVNIEDNFGNLVTSGNPIVTLSANSLNAINLIASPTDIGSISLGSAYVQGNLSIAANNGVAIFKDLVPTTAGEFSFTANSGADAPGYSDSFFVSPPDVHVVFVRQPGDVTAGAKFSPQISVELLDSAGNLLNNFDGDEIVLEPYLPANGSIQVSANDSGLVASPIDGVATFTNTTVHIPGNYEFEAILLAPGGLPQGGPIGIFPPPPIVILPSPPPIPLLSGLFQRLAVGFSDRFNVFPHPLAFARQPVNGTAGAPLSPAVVVNVGGPDGNALKSDSSAVTLTVTSGPADVGESFIDNALNGSAAFRNLTFDVAGNYTLTASPNGATALSQSFTIRPAAVARLSVVQPPNDENAGTMQTVVVNAYDAFGNLVSDPGKVAVSIASGPAGATIGGTHTAKLINGVATFGGFFLPSTGFNGFFLPLAGTYTLKFTTGNISTTTPSFTVSAGSPANLSFTQMPAKIVAGQPFTFTVQVTDQYGNIVQTAGNFPGQEFLNLYVNTGPNNSGFNYIQTPGLPFGQAEYQATITTAGKYTFGATLYGLEGSPNPNLPIIISVPILPSVQSSTLIVQPATAAKIVVASQPTSGKANQTLAPLTVNVEDQYGNLVTDVSQLSISLFSGPPGGILAGNLSTYVNNGVAVFRNLFVSLAGNYVFTIAGDNLPAIQTGLISAS